VHAVNITVTDTHWYWGIDKYEAKLTEYASIRRPFPLKNRREGKVKHIITAQTMLQNNCSRDSQKATTK